jgi:hypothetical protein
MYSRTSQTIMKTRVYFDHCRTLLDTIQVYAFNMTHYDESIVLLFLLA